MSEITITLAGNPNVGKSTLFNRLTGLRQHTGNWSGKTVGTAQGIVRRHGVRYTVVDLPGIYSLDGNSEDEKIAAEYLQSHISDCTVVVCDATCLERSLLLALQVLQICDRTVICINMMDEAQKNGIMIDKKKLSCMLSAPVVFTSAGKGIGLDTMLASVKETSLRMPRQQLPVWENLILAAQEITAACVVGCAEEKAAFRRKVDRLFVSRRFGVSLMLLLLFGIVWLTVWGANYPSAFIFQIFEEIYSILHIWMTPWPWWLRGVLLDGLYATSARVIAVMLPPMAIFFPLFTILEDAGYLPRLAFLLDPGMARCGGCGKQALTLCMGLGCNAVGVTGCRIIDSPRERTCAILTNAMIPCNGRFPSLILLGSLLFSDVGAAFVVAACVALGVAGAMLSSGVLSKTVLRSESSTFLMEIPPFRRPRLGDILVRSLVDRTLRVAVRALCVAAPAGIVLWVAANTPLLDLMANALNPIGMLLGMNGVILLGFLFSLPANELLLPVILMTITQAGNLASVGDASVLRDMLTWQMALCTMVFTVFHWPCSTTLITIYRETGDPRKTAAAFALPTVIGCGVCFFLNLILQYLCG